MPDLFESLPPDAKATATEAAGPILRTPRLLIRPLTPADAPAFHRLINDWDICRTLPDAPFPYPAALAVDWIAAAAADRLAGRAQQFGVVEAATDTLIGAAGLRLAGDQKSADLGYWLGRKHWGQAYGLEAARRLIEWGFAALSVLKITATVAADNEASTTILRRAGFSHTGKGKQAFQCRPGASLPVQYFSITREPLAARASSTLPVLLVVAVALIDVDGRILLARRPEGKKLAGLWEFPGGKVQDGEVPEAALARELKEELGIDVSPDHLAPFVFASHAYESFHLLMPLFLCRRWAGKPTAREGQALAWVAPDRLVEYPMPPADRPLIPMLRDFL
jgi:8-oxo-dGTP diphosphatase